VANNDKFAFSEMVEYNSKKVEDIANEGNPKKEIERTGLTNNYGLGGGVES